MGIGFKNSPHSAERREKKVLKPLNEICFHGDLLSLVSPLAVTDVCVT